jgi:hypothetical protein
MALCGHMPNHLTYGGIAAVLEALRQGQSYGRWVLIFDNADQPRHRGDYDLMRWIPHRSARRNRAHR